MKKVGVKYCGGCNPSYDRVGFVSRLNNKFADLMQLQAVIAGEEYDAILVVCGCKNCCADHQSLNAKRVKSIVSNESDYINTCNTLEKLIETTKGGKII